MVRSIQISNLNARSIPREIHLDPGPIVDGSHCNNCELHCVGLES